jgi:hypothetical protein
MKLDDAGRDDCSFCAKRSGEVKRLVVADRASICDECVEIARWLIKERGRYGFVFRGMRRWAEATRGEYRLLEVLVPSLILGLNSAAAVGPVLSAIQATMPLVVFVAIVLVYAVLFVAVCVALHERRALARCVIALSWLASGALIGRPFGWLSSGIVALGALLFLVLVWGSERREAGQTVGPS